MVGDTLAAGHRTARIVRMTHTVVTVRLGTLNYELDRRRLRRAGAATVRGRTFCVAPDSDQEAA